MRALLIDDDLRAACRAAMDRARKRPITSETLDVLASQVPQGKPNLALADLPPGFKRPRSEHVEIPMGYRAAISFEEQPVGLCKHISVSVDKPGSLPNIPAFTEICALFDVKFVVGGGRFWIEEFAPGHSAVNFVCPAEVH